MSIQDPPFGNPPGGPANPQLSPGTVRHEGTIPPEDAAKLREAGETVRGDLGAALDAAKSDFHALAETAKRDFAAVKDEALSQFQNLRGQAGSHIQSLTGQAGEQAESLKSQAQDQVRQLKGEAERQIGDVAEKAKGYAGEQAGQLADQARSFATQQKDLAARQFSGVVDAVSRVADELQSSQDGRAVAGYAQDLAGSLRSVADTIQGKSVDELFGLVQDFGRRQPLAFLGIAALTGFAASRFILASRSREVPRPAGDRAFDDEVPAGRGYTPPSRTAVELDRMEPSSGRTETGVRGVGDNGRI